MNEFVEEAALLFLSPLSLSLFLKDQEYVQLQKANLSREANKNSCKLIYNYFRKRDRGHLLGQGRLLALIRYALRNFQSKYHVRLKTFKPLGKFRKHGTNVKDHQTIIMPAFPFTLYREFFNPSPPLPKFHLCPSLCAWRNLTM